MRITQDMYGFIYAHFIENYTYFHNYAVPAISNYIKFYAIRIKPCEVFYKEIIGWWMIIEEIAIPMIIEDFQYIYENSIEEEEKNNINFRKFRFNLAKALLDLYARIGKLPYNKDSSSMYI